MRWFLRFVFGEGFDYLVELIGLNVKRWSLLIVRMRLEKALQGGEVFSCD